MNDHDMKREIARFISVEGQLSKEAIERLKELWHQRDAFVAYPDFAEYESKIMAKVFQELSEEPEVKRVRRVIRCS
jgi:hypothetical protein